jgi:hypothetical protein
MQSPSTLDESALLKLEQQLNQRPDKKELIERNILKGHLAFSSLY